MALIVALGSNLGDKLANLLLAKKMLCHQFTFVGESKIYCSAAVDHEDQPDFYNQVLEFLSPSDSPEELMALILTIEEKLGRVRDPLRPRGPRIIDIDIVFFDLQKIETPFITLPHPRWHERSFVVKPLEELPFAEVLRHQGLLPVGKLSNQAFPIK
ncbi:MAG: 2-amino-4-hydroxy-6-hydroxymethyldihydropteridine diphosphokinase [Oligoflexia bacterium]|nr:2-amino-4-hydroxy-6-hydroxymethyldihydropteridine diphosphokinase [Oligoflexia bacterium]MBF0364678.1 2-amino-4-hydroxy-6-hydroxymethyldihydropteridine diphosphokinase [Oligoflexia bacterium]